ncbi:MAG: type IV pilus twitching motility protein PilT [Deltaproteobacteria bacterium]|nr:type IV pilus twitching motility protein PilT [Deltaproteobacteria bacterium]
MSGVDRFLEVLLEKGASDLHLSAGRPPLLRLHGSLVAISGEAPLSPADVEKLVDEIAPERMRQREGDESLADLDFAHQMGSRGRFRVNVFRQQRGGGAVLRVIPTKIPTIAELGLPPTIERFARLRHGLVLVTGPTGSGKSTTLASIIHHINLERAAHILTIEDPIEFVHENRKSLVTQREIGPHATSFAGALRVAIRQDPDVILVGEMRDLETISLALTAAETGALVFGTLHTNSAAKTVDRMIDVFPQAEQEMARSLLANCLRGILSQQLVRTADGKGRACALEIAVCSFAVSNLIREGKTFQISSAIQSGKAEGMQTLEQALADLVEKKRISKEAAFATAINKDYLASLIGAPPE